MTGESRAYHHGSLRRALLDAAAALLAEERGWSFSLREVARRAGVSHNAPSRHFADKRDLLAALAVAGHDALTDRMRAAVVDADPAAGLIAIGVAYIDFAADNPARYRLMFGPELRDAAGALPGIVSDAATRSKDVLSEIIQSGARSGRFRAAPDDTQAIAVAVLAAWAMVHGLAMLTIDGVGGEVPAERVTRALLDGLLA